MLKRLSILLWAAASVSFAAGSVQQTLSQLGTTGTWVAAMSWTGDSITGAVPATAVQLRGCCQGYTVPRVVVQPGTPAPTNGYSVTISDFTGVDILAGAASSSSSTNSAAYSSTGTVLLNGTVTMTITGQNVASATGVVYIYFQSPPSFTLATASPTSVNWYTQITNLPLVDVRSYSSPDTAIASLGSNSGFVLAPPAAVSTGPSNTIPTNITFIDWRRLAGSVGVSSTVDNYWRTGNADGRSYIASIYGGAVRMGHLFSSTAESSDTSEQHLGLTGYVRMDSATPAGVALYGLCETNINSSTCFGSNIIAASPPGITSPKLVGLEIDVEPSSGVTPSNASAGLFVNAFNSAIPGPAILIGGVSGGTFANGLGCSGVASNGSCVFGSSGGTMGALFNSGVASYTIGAGIFSNTHKMLFAGTSGTYAQLFNDGSDNFNIVSGATDTVYITDHTGVGGAQGALAVKKLVYPGFTFSSIGSVLTANGMVGYCSDCTIANPCAGSGTGAIAKRLNGVNVCN